MCCFDTQDAMAHLGVFVTPKLINDRQYILRLKVRCVLWLDIRCRRGRYLNGCAQGHAS